MSALPQTAPDPFDLDDLVADAPTTPVGRPLLTVSEVAGYLRVSEMTVYRLITSRDLGATKIGRCWRVPADDLRAYLDDRHVVARAS